MQHYLKSCLEEFPEICRKKYGVAFDLSSVERKVARFRRRTPLTYSDLAYFESPEHWWFKRFWVFPPEEHVTRELEGATFDFWNLPGKNEAQVIKRLLYAFKSIELVSIILRFIKPEDYAILSSPTQRLLEIRRGRDRVETYLNYLHDLRDILDHCDFDRVADVDMALWVLHEKCFGTHKDPVIARSFSRDSFLMRLRARNLVLPLRNLSEGQLASALGEVKPDLASLIACYALEILIRRLAAANGGPTLGADLPLETVINEMPNYGGVDKTRKAQWKWLKERRTNCSTRGAYRPLSKQSG